MKFGTKVVVGQQDGVLGVFSWDNWGDVRFMNIIIFIIYLVFFFSS